MNQNDNLKLNSKNSKFLLALHSSTDTFGLGLIQIDQSENIYRNSIFAVKKDLSKYLFDFVEELLPSMFWDKIVRLAVAIGPGRYTGTRISVIFARTLAQQLNCQVDGISSFHLMAHRVKQPFIDNNLGKPFWITKALERRGIVAGQYQIIGRNGSNVDIKELQSPKLLPLNTKVSPSFEISENIEKDLNTLLNTSFNLYKEDKKGCWQDVLPIYPTSPIRNIN